MQQLNDETFINKWWSALSSPLSLDIEEWIKKSYSSDDHFWKEVVLCRQEQLLPPSHSDFGRSYNFYHDCILRYIKTNNIAFSIVKENDYPENWTYEKIHHCVNYHVDKWLKHHPEPGQVIAIVGPPDLHFYIALLTAFRFGLKICYLPTNSPFLGRGQIVKFLAEVKPQLLAAQDPFFSMEGVPSVAFNEKGSDDENHSPQSFAYPAAEQVLISVALQQQEELNLVHINSQTTYLHALRDALFTLNLFQHPYWAAPLSCPIRTEPCSTIMTLLCGVSRVYVSDDAVKNNPLILEDARINLLGLSAELQQLWNQGSGLPARSLKCCYRSPLDTAYQSWKSFIQLYRLEKTPTFEIIMDNSAGGAVFFSRPSLEPYNFHYKPTLGTSWHLSDFNRSGQETLTGFGIFESVQQSGKGNFTATQVENNLMLTGIVEPSRLGVTFPIDQLEAAVSTLSFVEGCMLHHLLKAGLMFSRYFVLLVFVDPLQAAISKSDIEHWTTEITKKITAELGSGYIPDKIEYFSLMPRKNILGIDRNWCANQFEAGLLVQKRAFPQYQMLGALKKLAQELAKIEA